MEIASDSGEDISNAEAENRMRQFAAITETDELMAQMILQDVNWNLERALEVYFASNGLHSEDKEDDAVVQVNRTSNVQSVSSDSSMTDLTGLEVSVLSWNIDGLDGNSIATRAKAVRKIVQEASPDFVFLQEVVHRHLDVIKSLNNSYNIYFSDEEQEYFTAILVSKMFDVENHEVIHYPGSGMGRTLQILKGRIGNQVVYLMTSHLESTGEHTAERKRQFAYCMDRIRSITSKEPNCVLFFGGDLNLRDNEVSNIPSGVADVWLATGAEKKHQYTWDLMKNTNKGSFQGFKPRCRFDRMFVYGPLRPSSFNLEGKRLIRTCLCYPSDHWAIHCVFKA